MKNSYMYVLMSLFSYFFGINNDMDNRINDLRNQINLEFGSSKKMKTELFHISHKTVEFQGLNDVLSSDYQQLTAFSETIKDYGITEENFGQLFLEGAIKSFNFYYSSKQIDQASINQLIDKELSMNSNLGHVLEKPTRSKTTIVTAFKTLNQFSGEWHGRWGNLKVHHLWLPVRKFEGVVPESISLIGFQSCFTGDGFGWNYVVMEKNRIIVLGFVCHFDKEGTISTKNPHYGFVNPNNHMTWISDNHLYYEFVCDKSNCIDERHYVITGGRYKKQTKNIKLVNGFQAIYRKQDQELPNYKRLSINL